MKDNKKVLFIAHRIMGAEVGLLRMRYWVNNISEQSNQSVICDLLAGDEQVSVSDTVNHIYLAPDANKGGLLKLFIKDEGLGWKHVVKKELESRPELNYDAIVLSGSPFMHFALVPYLKKRFKAKVILDFRDPFAVNPRFDSSRFKILIKRYYEKTFIEAADHIVTVNASCLRLLSANLTDNVQKFSIIANGYDDLTLDRLRLERTDSVMGKVRFAYPGKFYHDCKPNVFLTAISNDNTGVYNFEYVGQDSDTLNEFKLEANIKLNGRLPYDDTMRIVNKADVGLIFTGGKSFESTTKIYDYIGLEKAVLIITEGEVQTGELHEITRGYPKVFWSRNTKSDITSVLDKLKNEHLNFSNSARHEHSRKTGLTKLIDLIYGEY